MTFIRKVFYENKVIVFTDSLVAFIALNKGVANYLQLTGATLKHLETAENYLSEKEHTGVLIGCSKNEAKALLDLAFKKIRAAGGLVQTLEGATLMIFRNGKWDLPKGKQEKGEDLGDCAIREVREETGLPDKIELRKLITKTYHTYLYTTKKVLKTTYWYQMRVNKEYLLTPQIEEDISKAIWVSPDQLPDCFGNTWLTIKAVFEEAANLSTKKG